MQGVYKVAMNTVPNKLQNYVILEIFNLPLIKDKKDKVCSLCHQKITQFDSFIKTQLDDNVCEYQHDVCWWDYVLN